MIKIANELKTKISLEDKMSKVLSKIVRSTDMCSHSLVDMGDKGSSAFDKLSSRASKVGSVMKAVAGASSAVAGAAFAGAVKLSKAVVSNYADYEQLVGGVETLFGAGGQSLSEYAASVGKSVSAVKGEYSNLMAAQDTVMQNAQNAYMTAGLSANDYMETVTSFSASLISSMGGDTVAAANKADQALVQMSDNANKMGTSMEAVQNAYQGFAKQNYTINNLMSAA